MSETETQTARAPAPSRRRRRLILAGLVLVVALSVVAGYFYMSVAADGQLAEALAETDRTDPGWRILELEARRAVIPEEQNAAINLINARALLPQQWPSWDIPATASNLEKEKIGQLAENLWHLEPEVLLGERQSTALRTELKKAGKALAEVYKIEDKPHGRYPITYSKDFIGTSLDHSQRTRSLANLLAFDALLRAHDRDIEGAMRACRCIFHTQRAIGDEPTVISMLIRMAIHQVALKKIERTLAQGQPSEASLAGLQRLLEEDAAEPMLLSATRGERGMFDGCLAAIQSGECKCSWRQLQGISQNSGLRGTAELMLDLRFMIAPRIVAADRAALLRFNNQFVELARLPVEEHWARFKELKLDTKQLPAVARILAINWEKPILAFLRDRASLRCGIIMVAAERFRRAHKRWPERPDDLTPTYLTKVLADPFDGLPLRIRPFGEGIVIYSVSYDGQDNKGNLNDNPNWPGTDWGYRVWDVAKRRQPPRPETEQ